MRSKSADSRLYELATLLAKDTKNDYMVALLQAINPRHMSEADYGIVRDYLETHKKVGTNGDCAHTV